MSVIVAIKKNNKIYLGADTQTTCGNVKINYLGEDSRKLKLLDNGIILGAVGQKKGSKLIFSHPEFFTLTKDGELTKEHIALNIVPLIKNCLLENDLITFSKDNPPAWSNVFIVAHKDKLFWITKHGNVVTTNHYLGAGAGEDAAFPGLMKLDGEDVRGDSEVFHRLADILRVTATRRTGISAPFFLIDTETKEFQMVKE